MSFLNESDHNVLAPIAVQQPFQKNPVFYQQKQRPQSTTNAILRALSPSPSNKL